MPANMSLRHPGIDRKEYMKPLIQFKGDEERRGYKGVEDTV